MDVDVYTLEAKQREATPYPYTDWSTQDYEEAKRVASEQRLIVIVNHYVYDDSEPLDDCTGRDECAGCGASIEEEYPGGLYQAEDSTAQPADQRRYCPDTLDHLHTPLTTA